MSIVEINHIVFGRLVPRRSRSNKFFNRSAVSLLIAGNGKNNQIEN